MLEDVLKNHGLVEVSAMDAYTDIFRLGQGYIQRNGEEPGKFKTNPIVYMKNNTSKTGKYRILFEDDFKSVLEDAALYDFAITNGVTYFGRKATLANASKMYALIIDIDGQTDKTLDLMLNFAESDFFIRVPMPNYVALSGHNVHLYYIFKEPLDLYPDMKLRLKDFKYGLIKRIWQEDVSTIKDPQYQGINQGFRPLSAKTKLEGVRVRAFKTAQPYWTIDQLNKYVDAEYRVDPQLKFKPSKVSKEKAAELWPEWYKRRVINKEDAGKWAVSRNLYEWWKRELPKARYHHRYFYIMALAIYAQKTSHYHEEKNPNPVTYEELERDAYKFRDYLNTLNPSDPFTDADIESALECYDPDLHNMKLETISRLTAIEITRAKRNGLTRSEHMELFNDRRAKLKKMGRWEENSGRPSKEKMIKEYAAIHPEKSHREIAKDLGVSRNTVIKWLKKEE